MKELVVASRNRGKIKELSLLLEGVVEQVTCAADLDLPEVEEDGSTFEANAIKKAKSACAASGKPSLADDSGLVVKALDGRPGIYSARFAGEGAEDAANNDKLLGEMTGITDRRAAFKCVIALCLPDGACHTFDGELGGVMLDAPRGEGGFGYDPLFLVPEYGKTFAELSIQIKNRISHRGQALAKLLRFLGQG